MQVRIPVPEDEHPAGRPLALARTNASVAIAVVLSPDACVVADVPFGSAGVPLRLAAVPLVFTLPANVSAFDCAVAAEPAGSNADVGWNAAVPNAPPCAVVRDDAVTKVALVVAVKFAAVVADTAFALAPRKAEDG